MLLFPIVPVRKKIQFNKRTTVLGTSKNFSFERFSLDLICDVVMKNVLPCTFFIGEFRHRRNIATA